MGILQKKTLEKFHEFEFGIQDNDSDPQWYRFSNLLPGKSKFLNHSGSLVVLGSPRNHFRNFFSVGGWVTHPPTHQKGCGRSHRWFFGGSEVISSMSPWNHFWNCFSVGGWVENHRPNHQQCFGPPTCQSTVPWQVTPMVLWWFWGDIINVTSEPLSKFFFGGWGGWETHPPTH